MQSHLRLTAVAALRNAGYYATLGLVQDRREALRFWSRIVATAGKWRDTTRPQTMPPPRVGLDIIYPGVDLEPVHLERGRVEPGEVTSSELLALTAAARFLAPKRIFEFGTFLGSTTLHLARACPEAEIFTLDLPDVGSLETPLVKGDDIIAEWATSRQSERRFRGRPEASRVHELYGDSLTFDFSPYRASMDFIFVDAAHDHEHAAADTRNGLAMLAPGGTLFWHDYGRANGVTLAVQEAIDSQPNDFEAVAVEGTCLALLKPFPTSGSARVKRAE